MFYELSTNKHALLSNIELRTMSEGTNSDAGLRIVENEVKLEERRKLGGHHLIEGIATVMLTEVMPDKSDTVEKECWNLENLINHQIFYHQWEVFLP